MTSRPPSPGPTRASGAGAARLLAAVGIWLALAAAAVLWWKPWEQHPNVRRAAEREAGATAPAAQASTAADAAPEAPADRPADSDAVADAGPTVADGATVGTPANDGGETVPAELPDNRTLLRGSHVKLARVTEGRAEELESGAVVARGDRLRFGLLLPYRMHVYAFNQEQGAATTVMFPLDALAHRNPLPAGNNELPGLLNGRDASYEVMGRGASEEMLMVLAIEPNAFLEAKVAELGEVATGEASPPDPAGELSIDALARALEPAVRAHEVRVLRWTLRHAP
jgi:hypothetical protein